jgi:hypothetical protein
MEVIKEGPGWSLEVSCTGEGNYRDGCGSRLKLVKGDLYETKRSDYEGGSEIYISFKCCVCGVQTDLSDDERLRVQFNIPSKKDWEAGQK